MITRQDQIPNRHADAADAPSALRPVSPGIIAIALLLALTASVATAGVIERSDPARMDRREAPRELTVRWLTSAVARAARDLVSTEVKTDAATTSIKTPILTATLEPVPSASPRRDPRQATINPIQNGWSAQGLLNLPPPALR